MALENVSSKFGEKVGPLPVWGWVAVAGVGYFIWQKRYASTHPATQNATDTTGNAYGTGMTDQELANAYAAEGITAEYDLYNQLGVLDSNVRANTTATGANTGALTTETGAIKRDIVAVGANTTAVNRNTAIEQRENSPKHPGPARTGKFVRDVGTGAIWRIVGNKRWHVTPKTWAAYGGEKPAITQVKHNWSGFKKYAYAGNY